MKIELNRLPLFFAYVLVLLIFVLTCRNSFFWDTIQLGSEHSNYFYENGYSSFLPDSIDSGHIPAFGAYLSVIWKIFGRTLLVSHLAMLPFVLGIIWQTRRLAVKFIDKRYIDWAVLLIILDTTLLAQMTLVSPDVILMFLFITAMNSLLERRTLILSISVALMFLVSMRGMMISLCILIIDIANNVDFKTGIKVSLASVFQRITVYFPAFLIFVIYSLLHYHSKGWIGFHANSPWADSFSSVSFLTVIRNILVYIWRILDFGRIGVWAVCIILFFKYRDKIRSEKKIKYLFFMFCIFFLILPINMLWAKNLLAHRYLLPIYFLFSIMTANLLFSDFIGKKLRTAFAGLWGIILITGNLWIYPDTVSQGWDSSLAYLPYNDLRHRAVEYLDKHSVNIDNVQSFFPNFSTFHSIDLNDDMRSFHEYDGTKDYVFYSNVCNVSSTIYNELKSRYYLVKRFEKCGVFIEIYKFDKYAKLKD